MRSVEDRIAAALDRSGRPRTAVTLVAVSKKFSADCIRVAYQAGLRDFGENYVQEFAAKRQDLADLPDIRVHLIGHLQSNKARLACELFHVVHTVDSPKLLTRLDAAAAERQATLRILVEIKLSEEQSKTGIDPETLPQIISVARSCKHLALRGLMTMPPWSDDPETSRPYFRALTELAKKFDLADLSMGMSNDFEAAIEEGATIVRVGTALFGRRPKPANSNPAAARAQE